MQTSLLHSILFASLIGGCAGSGQFTYTGEVTAPELVVVSPGVQVIADLDEPIFYSNNYYWRNQGGYWYRSPNHTRGWARVELAPVEIRAIAQPAAYIHYHGQARANVPGDRKRDEDRKRHEHDKDNKRDNDDRHAKDDRHDKDDRHHD